MNHHQRSKSWLLYRMISSLINALEGECFCLREISFNVNQLLALLLLHVFIRYFILYFVVGYLFICLSGIFLLHFVAACLFLCPLLFNLILMLLLYFCLFINHVNKVIILGAFAYYVKKIISIFVIFFVIF